MIYLCLAHMSEEGWEQKYIKEAFDTNWVVPLGPNVNAFEADLAQYLAPSNCPRVELESSPLTRIRSISNASSNELVRPLKGEACLPSVVALSAGTAAVHLALLACGVGQGDEVLVQSFTFCASAHPVTYLGAKPVFVDSEPETWNMDPDLLELAIKDRIAKTGKKPKAIVPVALYGMPYDCERIMAIAEKYDIPVIEDAAEGFGSKYRGQMLGTFGRFGVLSFNGNKMITTSGGGALVCNGEAPQTENGKRKTENGEAPQTENGKGLQTENDLRGASDAQTIMWYATQARDAYPYYEHTAIGYNYRMSNVCAGIGRGQMKVAQAHVEHHQHVQRMYEELLAGIPGVVVHRQPETGEYESNYWLCTITLDENVRVVGQENAYKEVVTSAVGGAAGVIKAVEIATTECQPNDNVEALRVYMMAHQVEARPLWKPMHKQPVYALNGEGLAVSGESLTVSGERVVCLEYCKSVAYVNGVSERLFKTGLCLPAGPCVTDEDVKYIVDTIKGALLN